MITRYIIAALVIALAALGFATQHYKSNRDQLQLKLDAADDNASVCTVIEDANSGALEGLRLRLEQCVYDKQTIRTANDTAVRQALARAARADDEAEAWEARYNAALLNPSCAVVARMPICPELQRQ